MPRVTDTWNEYQKLVLAELERHSATLQRLDKRLNDIQVEIAMLKIKSGVWGLAGGLIPVSVALIMKVL